MAEEKIRVPICCFSPPGAVGENPRQPAQDVQDEALGVFRGGVPLRLPTQSVQQLLVEVQKLQHCKSLNPAATEEQAEGLVGQSNLFNSSVNIL